MGWVVRARDKKRCNLLGSWGRGRREECAVATEGSDLSSRSIWGTEVLSEMPLKFGVSN